MTKFIAPREQVQEKRAIFKIGHLQFIMGTDAAYALFRGIDNCEAFSFDWNSDTKTSEPKVKPVDDDTVSIKFLSDEMYALGKILHKADQLKKEQQP